MSAIASQYVGWAVVYEVEAEAWLPTKKEISPPVIRQTNPFAVAASSLVRFKLPNIALFVQCMNGRIKPLTSYSGASSNLDELVRCGGGHYFLTSNEIFGE